MLYMVYKVRKKLCNTSKGANEMRQLVFQNNDQIVTSSRNVARDFNKKHKNVIRDIRGLLKNEPTKRMFYETTYIHDQNNQEYKQYLMHRGGFTLLAMGLTGKKAIQFKIKNIEAFNKMEQQLKELNKPSYMIHEQEKRAEKWIHEYKERQKQEADKTKLKEQQKEVNKPSKMTQDPAKRAEKRIAEYKEKQKLESENKKLKPKASYHDTVIQSSSLLSVTQIAKDYGMGAPTLNKILHELGVQYKQGGTWFLYHKYQDKGYTHSKTHVIDSEKSTTHTYWTQKGKRFIYEIFKDKKGILPVTERENKQRRLVK